MKRKIIEINEELCTGCGECIPNCAEGSLRIIDGKARLVADKLCDGLGACLGHCPAGALVIIEREAEDFDQEAVDQFLAAEKTQPPSRCPSAQLKMMQPSSCEAANSPSAQTGSALSHWPVQIRLVPPSAPFLENCDLLIAADCTALAYAGLQQDFLQGRKVMMGCPKFDDQQLYVDRFTELFKTRQLKSVTLLIMEVPCCSAMLQIVRRAYNQAGAKVSVQQVVVSTQGEIVDRRDWQ
ncbi:MAG: 4Fe-4S binding domain-containing protein [Candidatus Electronema aureum]|uniref:4Fe-4S binding domain-containing protein n=1 Tax=Candidatus Electronema aureum TaxID=2005002 RepID=A0A521G0M6_9BACT|nr:MAG: 4Fe-4S binding domain-containing protein [Candidatus Electronema aureum]